LRGELYLIAGTKKLKKFDGGRVIVMSFQTDYFLKTAISTVLFPFTAANLYIRKKNETKEPGSIVNVDGRSIHTIISGEENGNPTVILDAGLSGNCLAWCLVQPEFPV